MTPLQVVSMEGRTWKRYADSVNFDSAHYYVQTGEHSGNIAVVECGGCSGHFVVTHGYSPKVIWPVAGTNVSEDISKRVGEAYKDARLALAAGSKIGALMAGRTTVTRLQRDKDVSSLKELVEQGVLTPALYGGADQLRLWAGIIGHEDISIDDFTQQEVEDVLNYLGVVLEAVYVHQGIVDKLVKRTEQFKDQAGN